MDSTVMMTAFWVVFVAELGDKTQLTALALATRFPWKKVFLGIALAFALLNLLAVVVGKILFALLPLFWIKLVSGGLFLLFGVLTLRGQGEEGEGDGHPHSARGPLATSFVMILLAELGDKTQLVTMSLAAQYSQLAVFVGSTLALWLVSLLGIFLGRELMRRIPLVLIHRGAGLMFLGFGATTLYAAFRLP
jgi:putative Ca2+/H+ antiporter (TMEM165/GDT1 family)